MLSVGAVKNRAELVKDADERRIDRTNCFFQDV